MDYPPDSPAMDPKQLAADDDAKFARWLNWLAEQQKRVLPAFVRPQPLVMKKHTQAKAQRKKAA